MTLPRIDEHHEPRAQLGDLSHEARRPARRRAREAGNAAALASMRRTSRALSTSRPTARVPCCTTTMRESSVGSRGGSPKRSAQVDHGHHAAAHLHEARDVGQRAGHARGARERLHVQHLAGRQHVLGVVDAEHDVQHAHAARALVDCAYAHDASARECPQVEHQRGLPVAEIGRAGDAGHLAPAGSSSGRTTTSCWPSMRSTANAKRSPSRRHDQRAAHAVGARLEREQRRQLEQRDGLDRVRRSSWVAALADRAVLGR